MSERPIQSTRHNAFSTGKDLCPFIRSIYTHTHTHTALLASIKCLVVQSEYFRACASSRRTLVASTHSSAYFLPPLAVCSFSIATTALWPSSSAHCRAVSPRCVCVCVCVHNIYIHIHIYVYMYIIQTQHLNSALTHTHTLSRVYILYIYIYIYIYIYTYIYTYIHISKYYYRPYYIMLRGRLYQLYMTASLVISIESNLKKKRHMQQYEDIYIYIYIYMQVFIYI